MKLALAQIDMRLGDIEGICGRIEDQARLAHERGARVLCVPAPLFMGAMPGGLVGAADFEHDMLAGLTGVAERIQELDMICIVPAAVSFEGQPLLDYMMLKDGHVVPARSSIALQRGENNDTRWAPPVFDVDGVRIAVIFDLDRELEMLPTGVDLIAYFQFNAGFNFKVWACAERAAFIADPILCYRQDNEKSSVNSPNKVFCVCDEYAEMQRFLDERPELKAQLQGILMRMKVDTYRWNDERLVDELREQFWEKASPELKSDWDAGRFDLSLFDPRGETDLRL